MFNILSLFPFVNDFIQKVLFILEFPILPMGFKPIPNRLPPQGYRKPLLHPASDFHCEI